MGLIPGHRPGNDVGAGIFPIQTDIKPALRILVPMGHETLLDHQLGPGCQMGHRIPLCGVHALDLDALHLHIASLIHGDLRPGIHDPFPFSISITVMLFHIFKLRVLSHKKTVDAVVAGFHIAAVVDPAAGDDGHIRIVSHKKVVAHRFI